jgi:hypothetical protein
MQNQRLRISPPEIGMRAMNGMKRHAEFLLLGFATRKITRTVYTQRRVRLLLIPLFSNRGPAGGAGNVSSAALRTHDYNG